MISVTKWPQFLLHSPCKHAEVEDTVGSPNDGCAWLQGEAEAAGVVRSVRHPGRGAGGEQADSGENSEKLVKYCLVNTWCCVVVTYPCTRAARSPADISPEQTEGWVVSGEQLHSVTHPAQTARWVRGNILWLDSMIAQYYQVYHFYFLSPFSLTSSPVTLKLFLLLCPPSLPVLLSGQTVLRQTQWRPAGTLRPRACGLRKKQPVSTSEFLVVFF